MKLNCLHKNKKIILLIFVFSLFVSIIPYLPNFQKCPVTESISTRTEIPKIDDTNLNTFVPTKKFEIAFPSSPSYSCREQLLPKLSQKPIALHEYIAKDGKAEYKVYTTVLPKKCFRWSKKIILNGALKILTEHARLPKKVLTTKFKKSDRYTILEYTLKQEIGKIQIIGKLILVDTSIYLIEVSIPEIDFTPDRYEKIKEFFQSFELS
ncbi:MAG: hypothetical protein ACRCSV_02710 [Chlamydiales bacterium]